MEKKQRKTQAEYEKSRRRNISHKIRVSESEEKILREKAEACNLSLVEYLIRMGIDGMVVIQDLSTLSKLATEINRIGVNINQIAHKVNSNNFAMQEDVREAKLKLSEIYSLMTNIINENTIKRKTQEDDERDSE